MLIQDVNISCTGEPFGSSSLSGIELIQIEERDWRLLRMARLLALRTSPEAFCGNSARERLANRASWLRRVRRGTWTVARSEGRVVGLAGMLEEPDPVGGPDALWGTRCLESVWVHPDYRGQGLLRHMLGAIEVHALGEGVGVFVLWVLETNAVASEVYRRLGYRPTGLAQPISVRGRWDVEHRLVKNIC